MAESEAVFGDLDVELVKGAGGVFEVSVDGQLVFSKKALDRFPMYQEIPILIQTG